MSARGTMKPIFLISLLVIVPLPAQAALAEPETISLLPAGSPSERECGIRADYLLSGAIMRVELSGAARQQDGRVFIRAYMPNSVGPEMRDLWLKTTTLFSLGSFKPARMNSQGILEASGAMDRKITAAVVREIADGDVEVSLIFDGVLPAARLPLGLPSPLPPDIAATLNDCAALLEK